MVEFAVAAMVMLLVTFGIMEYALLLYSYHTVSNAARQGSRWAIVRGTDCIDSSCPATATTVKTYVLTQMPLLNTSNATVTTTWSSAGSCTVSSATGPGGPGCQVAVTVSYPFNLNIPFMTASPLTLTSTSTMVIAH